MSMNRREALAAMGGAAASAMVPGVGPVQAAVKLPRLPLRPCSVCAKGHGPWVNYTFGYGKPTIEHVLTAAEVERLIHGCPLS